MQPAGFFAEFSEPVGDVGVEISEVFWVFLRFLGEYCSRRSAGRDGPRGDATFYHEAVGDRLPRSWSLGGHIRPCGTHVLPVWSPHKVVGAFTDCTGH